MESYYIIGIRETNATNAPVISFGSKIGDATPSEFPWVSNSGIQVSIRKSHNPYAGPEVVISWDPIDIPSDLVYTACKVMTLADLAANLNQL